MYLVRTRVVVRQLKQVNVTHGKEVLLQLLCHSITRECATLLMQRILPVLTQARVVNNTQQLHC